MTKLETLENNELIAVFDGAEYVNDAPEEYPDGYYCWDGPHLPEDFEYSTSWDWLMSIVDKIEKFKINFGLASMNLLDRSSNGAGFTSTALTTIKGSIDIYELDKTKLGATYKAVVTFIKWYNDKKG